MKFEYLQHAFDAATHTPQFKDLLHLKLLHFRENGLDLTVKPMVRRVIGARFTFKY